MNGPKKTDKLNSLATESCHEVWFLLRPSSPSGSNFHKTSSSGVVSEVARNASLNKRKDSTTECEAGKRFSWAESAGSTARTVFACFLEQLPQQPSSKAPRDCRILVVERLLIHPISGASSSHSLDGDVVGLRQHLHVIQWRQSCAREPLYDQRKRLCRRRASEIDLVCHEHLQSKGQPG